MVYLEEYTSRELELAIRVARDSALPETDRVAAIDAFQYAAFARVQDTIEELLSGEQPSSIQLAALAALDQFDEPSTGDLVLQHWSTMTPRVQTRAIDFLFAKTDRAKALLTALQNSQLKTALVRRSQIERIAKNWPELQDLAKQVLSSMAPKVSRRSIVERYEPSLDQSGNIERGRKIFEKQCAVCHQLEGKGFALGPNLATMKARGAEAILLNVLDPNLEVNPQYVSYTALLKSDRIITGMISSETSTAVTFTKQQDQSTTVLREEIETLQSSGVSIMPEGFEKQLSQQDMADLIDYLMSFN